MILFAIPGGAAIRLKKRTLRRLTSSVLSAFAIFGVPDFYRVRVSFTMFRLAGFRFYHTTAFFSRVV